jgi:predicted  nucleic acid-binding Zn-ribbon protein
LKCSKCGHLRRLGSQACPACGIIFEKYVRQEQRQLETRLALSEEIERRKRLAVTLTVGTLTLLILFILFSLDSSDDGQNSLAGSEPDRPLTGQQDYSDYIARARMKSGVDTKRLSASVFRVDQKEKDVTAFFVTDGCLALSSRIVADKERLRGRPEQSDDHTFTIIAEIDELEKKIGARRKLFMAECEDCSEKRFRSLTGSLQQRLERKQSQLAERQRYEKRYPDSKPDNAITLTIDRKRVEGRLLENNLSLGLTMITTEQNQGCTPITPAVDAPKQGDEIYLLDGRQRMARGKITGFTKSDTGPTLIRHDAKRNYLMEDAGAPAFNTAGQVVGISIPKRSKERFLLPIEDALLAFKIAP